MELGRILRTNGRLLLSTPNAEGGLDPNPYHLKEFMLDELLHSWKEPDSGFFRSEDNIGNCLSKYAKQ